MADFGRDVVDAVLRHMNDDHADDNLTIVRAFAAPDAIAATMTGLDAAGARRTPPCGGSTTTVDARW